MSKSTRKASQVQIVNPIAGSGITSRAHAARYVGRGVAEWVSESRMAIRFTSHGHHERRAAARACLHDGDGFATLGQVKGLPVIGPAVRLFTGHRPQTPPKFHPAPVTLSVGNPYNQSF